ncbi:hypothetical protein EMCRGX_G008463 [Ephydatia muelleri]
MSYHHKSGAQKRREKAMRTEGVLNEEDLLEIEEEPEEVPRSEPDIDAAGCSGWTEGPETPDAEALVVVAGVDIGIFIKGEVPTREEVEEAVRRCSKRLPLQFPNDSSNRTETVTSSVSKCQLGVICLWLDQYHNLAPKEEKGEKTHACDLQRSQIRSTEESGIPELEEGEEDGVADEHPRHRALISPRKSVSPDQPQQSVLERIEAEKLNKTLTGGGTLRASTLTNHVNPMTASWCGTPGRTQGKPALPWSQVGQRGGPTTHHDHVMVVARLVAPKASQRYLGPSGTSGRTQGKPALPWSQVGQWGGPTTPHDRVMVVAHLVAPKASQRYLGPRSVSGEGLPLTMTTSWCGTSGRTQGKPALPWSQVGQWGGPTTHHDRVMVVAHLVAPKARQRYLGPRSVSGEGLPLTMTTSW